MFPWVSFTARKPGDDVIITAAVSNEEAQQRFPGYKTIKPYLRVTKQPK